MCLLHHQVQAYDADEGQNAELTYSLSGRDWEGSSTSDLPITVDNKTGWLYTSRLLDREIHSKFQFQVIWGGFTYSTCMSINNS